ncbi:MAG: hypothetical protein HS115_12770 [Spirochaetales bacterium]|nr:hypothetical protein [Spirochaetales bacterium]
MSFFEQMKQSFVGVLIGFLLIPLSFVVLGYSSCRERVSEALTGAVVHTAAGSAGDKAVYTTGKIQAPVLGDPGFLRPGHYLSLERSPQMYAYKQRKKSTSDSDKNKKPEYECVTEWTSSPQENVGNKEGCRGKYNPPMSIKSYEGKVDSFAVMADQPYRVAASVEYYGMPSPRPQQADFLIPIHASGSYYYPDASCDSSSPRIGCMRISYSGTAYDPAADYTVIGALSGNSYSAYKSKKDNLYLALGPGGYQETMEAIKTSDATTTLILFAVAVLMISGGMSMIVGPLLTLIEQIPIIGNFGAGALRVIFAVIGFIVMSITYVFLRYWYLVLLLFLLVGAVIFFMAKKKKEAASAA